MLLGTVFIKHIIERLILGVDDIEPMWTQSAINEKGIYKEQARIAKGNQRSLIQSDYLAWVKQVVGVERTFDHLHHGVFDRVRVLLQIIIF